MLKWPLQIALLILLAGQLAAQSLPDAFGGKWYDPENPISIVEVLPDAGLIFLTEGMHAVKELALDGNTYRIITHNDRQQVIKMSFELTSGGDLLFALYPNQPHLYSQRAVPVHSEKKFELALEVGETYHLDVRIAETLLDPKNLSAWSDNPPKETVSRVWYSYTVIDQPSDSIYILDMEVKRLLKITRYRSGFSRYLDTKYRLPADNNAGMLANLWATEQHFRLMINRQGRIMEYRKVNADGSTSYPLVHYFQTVFSHFWQGGEYEVPEDFAARPAYLWSVMPPQPEVEMIRQQGPWAQTFSSDEYRLGMLNQFPEMEDPIQSISRGRITRYQLQDQSLLALDNRNGWIKYGLIRSHTAERDLDISLSGWSEKHRQTVLSGQLLHLPLAPEVMEIQVKRYLEFWQNLEVDIRIDADGHFHLSCYPEEVIYHPENKLFPLYLRPGDSIHIATDLNRRLYTVDFSGDAAVEYAIALQEAEKLPARNITHQIRNDPPEVFLPSLLEKYQKDSLQLAGYKSLTDPLFYRQVYWDQRYFLAGSLLNFARLQLRPFLYRDQTQWPDYLRLMQQLPINNDETAGMVNYQQFLSHTYLPYRSDQLRNFIRGHSSRLQTTERYPLGRYIFAGAPLFNNLAATLKTSIRYDLTPPKEVFSFLEDFRAHSPDTIITQQLERAYRELERLEPGNAVPAFRAVNPYDVSIDTDDLTGRNTLLIPFVRNDIYLQSLNFDSLQAWYPELRIALLTFNDIETWKNNPDFKRLWETGLIYFIEDEGVRRRIHDHFRLYNFSFPATSFKRAYLLDKQARIFAYFQPAAADPTGHLLQLKLQLDELTTYEPPSGISRETLGIIAGSLLLGSLFAWLVAYWKNRREKRRRRMIELEIRSLRAQLNPHFIFNTMSSIQNLIASQRPELANDYLADLAALMRKVLRYTQRGTISLAEELDLIRQYCALENLRRPFELHIENEGDNMDHEIDLPALILQPYVENAIFHGLASLNGSAKIDIQVKPTPEMLFIRIIDNGIGLQQAALKTSNGNNIGLKMNAERLKLLYGDKAKVRLIDCKAYSEQAQGTVVELQIPRT